MKMKLTAKAKKYNTFIKKYGQKDFATKELVIKYVKATNEFWGTNIVIFDIKETNGKFNPIFNVFA